MRVRGPVRHLRAQARLNGVVSTALAAAGWATRYAVGYPRSGRGADATFRYAGAAVTYVRHPYNATWLNERAVEVALAQRVIETAAPHRTLELGNVLAHYAPVRHHVVDKYERAPGVQNADIADVPLETPLDLVVSVSTLEHVGLDEEDQDPDKPRRVAWRLAAALAPGGRMWMSIPVGYNHPLDAQLRGGELPFTEYSALRRVGPGNRWEQVAVDELWSAPYDRVLWTATGVLVAEYRAPLAAPAEQAPA